MENILSVDLQATLDNFRAGMREAAAEAMKTDAAVKALQTNVIKNVSAVNNTSLTTFTKSMARAREEQVKTVQAMTVLSTSISANVANINKQDISKFTASMKAGTLSLASLTPALNNVPKGANQAANALTNLGRVAQDAPFGFIGIQNNLNPLLESYQRLVKETGSVSGAFKALGSSLMGPAGVGIALSVVSAGILIYQQYQQRANKATLEAAKAMQNAKKSAEEYAATLDDISRARLQGSINAQKELTELKTLYSITQDTSLSIKQRGDAVDALQKKYPEYFKNVKDEVILAGEASGAYNKLTTSILATARARAAESIITKNTGRILENETKAATIQEQIEKRRVQISQQIEKIRRDQNNGGIAAGGAGVGAAGGIGLAKMRASAEKELNALISERNNLNTDSSIINGRNLKLEQEILKQVKAGADLDSKVGDLTETKEKKTKTYADVMKGLSDVLKDVDAQQKNLRASLYLTPEDAQRVSAYTAAIRELNDLGYGEQSEKIKELIRLRDSLYQLPTIGNTPSVIGKDLNLFDSKGRNYVKDGKSVDAKIDQTQAKDPFTKYTTAQREAFKKQQDFNKDFNSLVENGISEGLGNFGNAIGETLINGGSIIDAAGGALLGSFGSFLSEYGRLLTAYGVAAVVKGKLDAAALVPGAGLVTGPLAIAAGVALQAAGAAIGAFVSGKGKSTNKNQQNKGITAFADGGIISGPTIGLMGEYAGAKNNPEVVAPLNKLKGMLGNTGKDVFIADTVISGENIVISYRKASARLGRT